MKNFMDKDFLLSNEISKKLYHDFSSNMPIIDYHCHINPVRIDVKSWIRKVTVVGITQKIESVLAFTAVKSSVDVDKISFNTFMEAYKYQLQRDAAHALNENDLMKEIKRAKEVYNLLKTDSAESTLVFDTLKLPGQNIHPAFIH